jgi:hypothetical protein
MKMRGAVAGFDLQSLAEQPIRFSVVTALMAEHAQEMLRVEVIALGGDDLTVNLFRLRKVTGLVCGPRALKRRLSRAAHFPPHVALLVKLTHLTTYHLHDRVPIVKQMRLRGVAARSGVLSIIWLGP